jgi:hypothetical protein
MELPLEGGCLCGAVRYACHSAPTRAVACHCRDCQKACGAPYTVAFPIPAEALRITRGEPREVRVTAEGGAVAVRGFCPDCGSHLYAWSDRFPQVRSVRVATLDDPSPLAPSAHLYVRSALPWVHLDDGLPRFDTMPDVPSAPYASDAPGSPDTKRGGQ